MKLKSKKAQCEFTSLDVDDLIIFLNKRELKTLKHCFRSKDKMNNLQNLRNDFVKEYPKNSFTLGGMAYTFRELLKMYIHESK